MRRVSPIHVLALGVLAISVGVFVRLGMVRPAGVGQTGVVEVATSEVATEEPHEATVDVCGDNICTLSEVNTCCGEGTDCLVEITCGDGRCTACEDDVVCPVDCAALTVEVTVEASPVDTPSEEIKLATVTLTNYAPDMCFFYIAPSDQSRWGANLIEDDWVASGDTVIIVGVQVDTVDWLAVDCDGNMLAHSTNFTLPPDIPIDIQIPAFSSGVLITNNATARQVCEVFISASGADDRGKSLLMPVVPMVPISPSQWVRFNLASGRWDVRVQICGGPVLEYLDLNIGYGLNDLIIDDE
jgi:hypothetical protein